MNIYNISSINMNGHNIKGVDAYNLTDNPSRIPSSQAVKNALAKFVPPSPSSGAKSPDDYYLTELPTIWTDVPEHPGVQIMYVEDKAVTKVTGLSEDKTEIRTTTPLITGFQIKFTTMFNSYKAPTRIFIGDEESEYKIFWIQLTGEQTNYLTTLIAPDVQLIETTSHAETGFTKRKVYNWTIQDISTVVENSTNTTKIEFVNTEGITLILHNIHGMFPNVIQVYYDENLSAHSYSDIEIDSYDAIGYPWTPCLESLKVPYNDNSLAKAYEEGISESFFGTTDVVDDNTIPTYIIPQGCKISYALGQQDIKYKIFEPSYSIVLKNDSNVKYENPTDRFKLINEEDYLTLFPYRHMFNITNDMNCFRTQEKYDQTYKVKIDFADNYEEVETIPTYSSTKITKDLTYKTVVPQYTYNNSTYANWNSLQYESPEEIQFYWTRFVPNDSEQEVSSSELTFNTYDAQYSMILPAVQIVQDREFDYNDSIPGKYRETANDNPLSSKLKYLINTRNTLHPTNLQQEPCPFEELRGALLEFWMGTDIILKEDEYTSVSTVYYPAVYYTGEASEDNTIPMNTANLKYMVVEHETLSPSMYPYIYVYTWKEDTKTLKLTKLETASQDDELMVVCYNIYYEYTSPTFMRVKQSSFYTQTTRAYPATSNLAIIVAFNIGSDSELIVETTRDMNGLLRAAIPFTKTGTDYLKTVQPTFGLGQIAYDITSSEDEIEKIIVIKAAHSYSSRYVDNYDLLDIYQSVLMVWSDSSLEPAEGKFFYTCRLPAASQLTTYDELQYQIVQGNISPALYGHITRSLNSIRSTNSFNYWTIDSQGNMIKIPKDGPLQNVRVTAFYNTSQEVTKLINKKVFKYIEETSKTPNMVFLSKYMYNENGRSYELHDCYSFETTRNNLIVSPKIMNMSVSCSGTIFYPSCQHWDLITSASTTKVFITNYHITEISRSELSGLVYLVLTPGALDCDWSGLTNWLNTYVGANFKSVLVSKEEEYDLSALATCFGKPVNTYVTLDEVYCDEEGNIIRDL